MDEVCGICFEPFRNITKITCGHRFCNDCIFEWLDRNNSCPNCRKVVDIQTLPFKYDSKIIQIGLENIHKYSLESNLLNFTQFNSNYVKGNYIPILEEEKQFIYEIFRFNVGEQILGRDYNNSWICKIKDNCLFFGKKINVSEEEYIIKFGFVLIRNSGTLFPISPKDKKYNYEHFDKFYLCY